MSSAVAHTSTVPTPGPGSTGLQPSNLLGTVLKGLYDSANTTTQNFGFTIPQAAVLLGALIVILLTWSMIASLRNRKHFSLEDDNGELHPIDDRIRSGVLRTESGEERS